MASSTNPLIFAFLCLVFFIFFLFFFENKSLVSAIREEEGSSELQHNTHHRVSLSSLFPSSSSSSCISPPQGRGRKGSIKVVHKNGPCSELKLPSSSFSPFNIPNSEILKHDKAIVRAIRSKLSKTHKNHHQEEVVTSKKGLDRIQLLANSGILAGSGTMMSWWGWEAPRETRLSSLTQAVTSLGQIVSLVLTLAIPKRNQSSTLQSHFPTLKLLTILPFILALPWDAMFQRLLASTSFDIVIGLGPNQEK